MDTERTAQPFDPASFEHVPVLLNECLDGLKIDPCIPHTLPGFTVTRRYRGAVYHIRVENPAAVQKGVKRVTVNGKTIEGNVLPLAPAGETVEVTVVMG